MVEALLERDELVLDTPFLRRIRRQAEEQRQKGLEEGQEKGHKKGLEEGHKRGIEEGRKEGLEEGVIQARQRDILNLVVWRYNPAAQDYLQLEKQLLAVKTAEGLAQIFEAAARSEDFGDFHTIFQSCINEGKAEPKSS